MELKARMPWDMPLACGGPGSRHGTECASYAQVPRRPLVQAVHVAK